MNIIFHTRNCDSWKENYMFWRRVVQIPNICLRRDIAQLKRYPYAHSFRTFDNNLSKNPAPANSILWSSLISIMGGLWGPRWDLKKKLKTSNEFFWWYIRSQKCYITQPTTRRDVCLDYVANILLEFLNATVLYPKDLPTPLTPPFRFLRAFSPFPYTYFWP